MKHKMLLNCLNFYFE